MVSRAELGYEDDSPSFAIEAKTAGGGGIKKTPSSKTRRRRRIDFSPHIVTMEVEHMDDLPGELIWYNRDEYDDIKQRNSEIIRSIKAGEFEENDEYSCRGLEHKLKEVFRQRRANKFNALNAVLEEQDRQLSRGAGDPQLICAAYQTVSVRCQESACTIALRDYKFSLCYDPDVPASGKPKPKEQEDEDNTSKSSMKKKKKKDKEKKNGEVEETEQSPKGEKKKGVRRVVHGARKRMMRRMSM